MKHLLLLLLLSILIGYNPLFIQIRAEIGNNSSNKNLKEIWLDDDQFSESADLEAQIQNDNYQRNSDLDSLTRAKYKLISGDLLSAKFFLNRIEDKKSKVYALKKRYLAIIFFIEGKFDESLKYLTDKQFAINSQYQHICLLKLINYMAVNDLTSLINEKEACISSTQKYSKNDQYWLDTMIKLKLKNKVGLKKNMITDVELTLSDDEMSRLWLKTGLYLNKEKELLEILSLLPENSYQSKRLREIIAFMYLRSGSLADKQKTLSFIDDIDSSNAENIKGTINLKNKEYELAFGHFKLALQKKQDSTDSLERAIPLAWLLNQWRDGIDMLDGNINKNLDPRNKKALRIAFLIREKKYVEAQKELNLLKRDFQQVAPFEVNIMDSYVTLVLNSNDKKFDKRKMEETSEKACRSFDGISCWISLQLIQWDNLGKAIKREDEIFGDKQMTVDSLRDKQPINPLIEKISVDQKDIEELDGAGIQLMKVLPN